MPELFDDRRELNEGLEHKLDIYGLPLVLQRLGDVVASRLALDPAGVVVHVVISIELVAPPSAQAVAAPDVAAPG